MKDLIYKFLKAFAPKRLSNERIIGYFHRRGIKIGQHTKIFDINHTVIDISRPWLLEIGDYCKITRGVVILTHDYSRSVLRRVYGDVVESAKKTRIGDNVFIGMNSIILMGANIGDNVIIGAGSVVKGNIPDNCVAAGNPAKVICTLEQFYNKRKAAYREEAMLNAIEYKKQYGKYPSVETMGAFFPLYLERKVENLKQNNIRVNLSGDDQQEIVEAWLQSEAEFASFEEFLKACDEMEKTVR